MIDFLLSLPLWALAVVLNVWPMGFALGSLWALRRWILPRLHLDTDASRSRVQWPFPQTRISSSTTSS